MKNEATAWMPSLRRVARAFKAVCGALTVGMWACSALAAASGPNRNGESAHITVQADQPGIETSPMLYGIFFEEINRAGEGGIYAEMIQNRSFEDDDQQPLGWRLMRDDKARATMSLDRSHPLNANNPTSLRLEIGDPAGGVSVVNEGFKGACGPGVPSHETKPIARNSPKRPAQPPADWQSRPARNIDCRSTLDRTARCEARSTSPSRNKMAG